MERPSDVRWGNDDAVRPARMGGIGVKVLACSPELIPSRFDGFRIVRFVELERGHGLRWREGEAS